MPSLTGRLAIVAILLGLGCSMGQPPKPKAGGKVTEYHYDLFADHHQFSLEDEGTKGDLSASWTPEAVAKLLALAPGVIGVGTVRAMTVPVTVEVRAAEPAVEESDWDQVNEASLEVKSGGSSSWEAWTTYPAPRASR